MLNQIESDRLMQHVQMLVSFHTRHVNSPMDRTDRGIGAAKNYIMNEFKQIEAASRGNLTAFGHDFTLDWNGVTSRQTNVVAIISGTEVGGGTIIAGAHYDTRGNDINDATGYAPGANDNGTGVSALIELGRVLSQQQHRATIVLVAFSAEEVGRQGSIAFVNDYVRRNNIDLMTYINIDAIGSQVYANGTVSDDKLRVFSKGPNDTSLSRKVARMTNFIAFNYIPSMDIVVQDAIDREGRWGDHMSFEEAGYPAIRFIEMAENSAYMDTTDTADGIHPGYFKRSTQTILATILALADGPRPPQNISLRENGDGTRTLVWNDVPNSGGYVVALRQPDSLIYGRQFEVANTSVRWDGFRSENFAALAIAAKDSSGLMGPLSSEIIIR